MLMKFSLKKMKTKEIKKTTNEKSNHFFVDKKISKIGQWLAGGEAVGEILDMRAVLR